MIRRSTIFAALAALWILIAIVAFTAGEHVVAGLALLATSFTIYLRETRA